MARGKGIKGSRWVKRNHLNRKQVFQECAICGEKYDLEEDFLKHIRFHKLSQAEYFQKYFPRYDKHTGAIIKFKNRDFYLSNDFNDKKSLKAWIVNQPLDVQKAWCIEALAKRREEKGLKYTPCQLELRTIMIPSANFLNQIFGNYYAVCGELGYSNKYKKLQGKIPFYPLPPNETRIVVDTREQRPLKFENFETVEQKLDEGDYALENEILSGKTRIERKSTADFFGTLGKMGIERFTREIDRAIAKGVKLVVLVEAPIEDVYALPELPQYKSMKIHPEFILHQMRELIQEFPQIQFLFVKDREDATKVTERLLQSRGEFTSYDLQLAYDMGQII